MQRLLCATPLFSQVCSASVLLAFASSTRDIFKATENACQCRQKSCLLPSKLCGADLTRKAHLPPMGNEDASLRVVDLFEATQPQQFVSTLPQSFQLLFNELAESFLANTLWSAHGFSVFRLGVHFVLSFSELLARTRPMNSKTTS